VSKQSGWWRNWIGRLLIGTVLVINVQCAALFLWTPEAYAPSFELSGTSGEAMMRALGLLFLMWNVPYAFAAINPQKYRISLFEAILMQAIGLSGETLLLLGLPPGHQALRAATLRFIFFDGGGLLALILAALVTRRPAHP
jgi:hypothetical protein